MLFTNLVKSINFTAKRFAGRQPKPLKSWPNDWVPFHWNRPEFVPGYFRGGDLVDLGEAKKQDLIPEARNSQKLKSLDPSHPLRRTYTLDNGTRYDYIKAVTAAHMAKIGLIHEIDLSNSREAKIIRLTYLIRGDVEIIRRYGTDHEYSKNVRTACNSLVHRRFKYLCELKELHSERYHKIIKELKIQPEDNPINVPFVRPYRKKQMRKLTKEYCQDLKEKKVDEYMQSLEKEKEEFEKEKKNTLQWIKEQEDFLGITV